MLQRIVLVHGAWHGAWCWELLAPLLVARGYEVSTLDLPGAGSDGTAAADVTFKDYVDRVADVVASGRKPVMLLGHSMGGMPVSAVAEQLPLQVGKLIYLAAMLPMNGECSHAAAGVSAPDSGTTAGNPSFIQPDVDAGVMKVDPAMAAQIFYNTCATDIAARASARLRPQPLGPLGTPITLSEARWGHIPKTYISCSRDQALPVARQQWLCARRADIKRLQLHTDHSPFYSDPAGLADLLQREAELP
jgi:alpha-beta hydrolase superfamily lysophospholipase